MPPRLRRHCEATADLTEGRPAGGPGEAAADEPVLPAPNGHPLWVRLRGSSGTQHPGFGGHRPHCRLEGGSAQAQGLHSSPSSERKGRPPAPEPPRACVSTGLGHSSSSPAASMAPPSSLPSPFSFPALPPAVPLHMGGSVRPARSPGWGWGAARSPGWGWDAGVTRSATLQHSAGLRPS